MTDPNAPSIDQQRCERDKLVIAETREIKQISGVLEDALLLILIEDLAPRLGDQERHFLGRRLNLDEQLAERGSAIVAMIHHLGTLAARLVRCIKDPVARRMLFTELQMQARVDWQHWGQLCLGELPEDPLPHYEGPEDLGGVERAGRTVLYRLLRGKDPFAMDGPIDD